jgi:hypothetical protein
MKRQFKILGMCLLITLTAVADTQEGQPASDSFMQMVLAASELRQEGQKEKAVALYQKAISLYPEHPRVLEIELVTALTLGGEGLYAHLCKVLSKYDFDEYYSTENGSSMNDVSMILPDMAYNAGGKAMRYDGVDTARTYYIMCLDMLSQTHERRVLDWLESPPPNLAYQSVPQRREEALKAHEDRRTRAAEGPLWVVEETLITHLLDGKPMGSMYLWGGYQHKPEVMLIGLSTSQYAFSYSEEERVLAMRKLQARYPKGNPVWTAIDYVIKYYKQ